MPTINVNGLDYPFSYEMVSEEEDGKKTYQYNCNSKDSTITIMPSGTIFMEKSIDDPFDSAVMMEIANYIRNH